MSKDMNGIDVMFVDEVANPGGVSSEKAKKILRHGSVRGRRLTPAQRGFFGARAGGAPIRK